jgi:hypothetical protein
MRMYLEETDSILISLTFVGIGTHKIDHANLDWDFFYDNLNLGVVEPLGKNIFDRTGPFSVIQHM